MVDCQARMQSLFPDLDHNYLGGDDEAPLAEEDGVEPNKDGAKPADMARTTEAAP